MSVLVQYVLPVFYIAFLAFVLTYIKWLQRAGFAKRFIVIFFVAKCLAGFAYNWVAIHYIPNRGDIGPFFDDGLYMYHSFLQSPSTFFQTWSQSFKYDDFNALHTDSGFIKSAFEIIKTFHFLLNFLSFGSLAGNTVIFNFLTTLCFFYCWRFFREQLGRQGLVAGLVFFLLPSMFFYSSGILKEGLVIALLCLLIPLSQRLLTARVSVKRLLSFIFVFALLFVLKFFVAILWLFCMAVWWLMASLPKREWLVLSVCIAVAAGFFFYGEMLSPRLNFPEYLVKRQQEFLALPAASALPVKVLTAQPVSFVKAMPSSINNVLFKPLPGEGGKAMYLLFSAEMVLFWLGILYLVFKRKKEPLLPPKISLAIALLLFAMLNLWVIGLIVPNVGAILRYRSIFFPFLAVFVIIITGWQPHQGKTWLRLAHWVTGPKYSN